MKGIQILPFPPVIGDFSLSKLQSASLNVFAKKDRP